MPAPPIVNREPTSGRLIGEDNEVINLLDLLVDGSLRVVSLAASGRSISDDAHTRIHAGRLFDVDAHNIALANNGSLDIVITTGAYLTHVAVQPASEGTFEILVYEGPTFTGGTLIPAVNHKRTSTQILNAVVKSAPSVSAVGIELAREMSPGGSGGQAVGARGSRASEWILAPSTSYLFRLTNVSGQTRRAAIEIEAYETGSIPDQTL
jgi:hypothetical protein